MNIEKLAKHLKEFSLDEIEIIAECDCKIILEHLLNSNKIVFEQEVYKFIEDANKTDFGIFIENDKPVQKTTMQATIQHFLQNYVARNCAPKTLRIYKGIFKSDIIPTLKRRKIQKFDRSEIIKIYNDFLNRNFKPHRIKNAMALLKQFLKYSKAHGFIESYTNFCVKRLSSKNEFSLDRITFEK